MRAREFIVENRLPREVERHLQHLTPGDVGVDEVGDYRIHFEGFTDDCKLSSDYQADPEAVYQEVWNDFKQREGGREPVASGMVGDEEYPVLFSVFTADELNESVSAEEVVDYVNTIHPAEEKTDALDRLILSFGSYELKTVPVAKLQIDAEEDPHGRVIHVDTDYASDITPQDINHKPIVIDTQGHILDGNHRAWQARELGITHVPAYVPVKNTA